MDWEVELAAQVSQLGLSEDVFIFGNGFVLSCIFANIPMRFSSASFTKCHTIVQIL